jgi:hypothetical protein
VTNPKLKRQAVTNAKLGNESVGTSKLAKKAVTESKLGAEAVTAGKLAGESVSAAKLSASFYLQLPSAPNSRHENAASGCPPPVWGHRAPGLNRIPRRP